MQRRLRRWGAARAHRLPQLREPRRPEIGWELSQAIEGIAPAAERLGIPVVSGTSRSTTRPAASRSRRRPSSAASGSFRRDRIPSRWRRATASPAPRRGRRARALHLADRALVLPGARRFRRRRSRAPSRGGAWSGVSRRLVSAVEGRQCDRCARADPTSAWPGAPSSGSRPLMCGGFRIRAPGRDVARLSLLRPATRSSTAARSQPASRSRENGRLTALRELGLVTQVFDEHTLSRAHGEPRSATRATLRPARTRGERAAAAPPWPRRTSRSGTTATSSTRDAAGRASGSGSARPPTRELIAALIADDERPLEEAIAATMARLEGAATVVGLADGTLFAFRDPHGFRPLVLGRLGDDRVVASETCALDLLGADVRARGRAGRARARRRRRLALVQALEPAERRRALHLRVLLPRPPDTRLAGVEVHGARVRMGERLAEEAPVEADLVLPIPTRARPPRSGSRARLASRSARG